MGTVKKIWAGKGSGLKKIPGKVLVYIKNNLMFLGFVVCCLFSSTVLRGFTLNDLFYLKPLLADAAVIMILGAIGYFIRPSRRFIYYIVLVCVFSILSFANSIYYTNFKSFVSASQIATAAQLNGVMDAVTENIMEVKDFIFLLPIPLYVLLYIRLRRCKGYFSNDYDKKKTHKTAVKTFIIAIGVFLVFCTQVTATNWSRLYKSWNRVSVMTEFGEYTYTISDIVLSARSSLNTVFGMEKSKETFNSFYESSGDPTSKEEEKKPEKTDKYKDIFEGKNMLVIHAESIQQFVMDTSFNGVEVTPNLNKIAKEGIYFSNFYAQESVGTSSDSEFTFSSSLMPASSGTVAVNYADRMYVTTQKLLKEKGYYTFSMHANNGSFWNRLELHESLGYDKFFNYTTDYDIDLDDPKQIVGMGLNDKDFFSQSVDKIKTIAQENEHWMGTLIMLSNHTPFTDAAEVSGYEVDFKYKTLDPETGEYETVSAPFMEETKLGNYFKSVNYADQALGELIDKLDKEGLLENTVVVIYGDHDAKVKESQYERYLNYDPYTDSVLDEGDEGYVPVDEYCYNLNRKVPFIIWTKDHAEYEPVEITDIGGMFDCQPTLGYLFGYENRYALGHNLLGKGDANENTVILPNSNFITDSVYYSAADEEYFDLTDYKNVMTAVPVNQQTDYSKGLPTYTPPEEDETEDETKETALEEKKVFTVRDKYSNAEISKRYNDGIVSSEYISERAAYAEQRMDVSDAIIFHDMIRVNTQPTEASTDETTTEKIAFTETSSEAVTESKAS